MAVLVSSICHFIVDSLSSSENFFLLFFSDSRNPSDSTRHRERAPLPAETLAEEPGRAELQACAEDALRSPCHAGRAPEAPGPAVEPHHRDRGASTHTAAEEEKGGEEEQEEEREEIHARRGDPQPVPSPHRHDSSSSSSACRST